MKQTFTLHAHAPKRPLKLPARPEGQAPRFDIPTADELALIQESLFRVTARRQFELRLFNFFRRYRDIDEAEAELVSKRWWCIQKYAVTKDEEWRRANASAASD